jgi:hypothetical protein
MKHIKDFKSQKNNKVNIVTKILTQEEIRQKDFERYKKEKEKNPEITDAW